MKIRNKIGLWVTSAWICSGISLIIVRLDKFFALELNALGDFFAGFFSPIAFLWLILGYLQQGEEVHLNTEALKLQAKELENSVREQAALVQATARQVALMELVQQESREQLVRSNQLELRRGISSSSSSTADSGRRHRIQLINVGHSVSEVKISCSLQVNISPDYLKHFDQGQKIDIHMTFWDEPEPSGYISFDYIDGLGAPNRKALYFKNGNTAIKIAFAPQELERDDL